MRLRDHNDKDIAYSQSSISQQEVSPNKPCVAFSLQRVPKPDSSKALVIQQEAAPAYHGVYIRVKLPIVEVEVQELGDQNQDQNQDQKENGVEHE